MHPFRLPTLLATVAMLLSTILMPATPAAQASVLTDHTADPTGVALAGDFQDELGCPGDWQPDCAATELTDAGNSVWRGQFALPAGEWEYKAALNDAWDEAYPADNKPLSVTEAMTVTFFYDHKTHAVLDSAGDAVAVAAGSFQSELGCPGDWQPDCVRSLLTDADADGVYTFGTTGIPAGEYEFKVAFDEAWGNGEVPADNVPFTVGAAGDALTISWDSGDGAVNVTVEGDTPGQEIDPAALAQPPVEHPIQDGVFYFVMPDRFENGDPSNDTGGIAGDKFNHGFDPADKAFYHGGDLAGLASRLDYLAGLGITEIWMTPMFKNRPVQGEEPNISAGYHGYWFEDYTQIDPHFGSNVELSQVITGAGERGIDIFFDIITNHTADVIQYEGGTYAYRNKTEYPYRDANGDEFDDRDYVGSDTFPELDPNVSFPYTPTFGSAADATVKVPAWLNDPNYYHNRGNSSFSGENSLYGDFFGLDDLFTEHPDVVEGMIEIYEQWITDYDIAGFRVDTMKHVNAGFWREFAPAIQAHARSIGKDDFFIFGEVFSGNADLLSFYTGEADVPAVLDFKFQEAVRSYVSQGGSAQNLADMFRDDDLFTDANNNAYNLPTFVGNHDRGRFAWFLTQDNSGLSDDEMSARIKLAHAMMYFARGVPVIYYGDEQGFVGDGGDQDARQDMFESQVDTYNDDDLVGTDATTADSNFDTDHPLYTAFAEYAATYQAHTALRRGAQIHRYAADGPGIYAFSRIDRDEQIEYVIAFNNAAGESTATVPTFYGAGVNFARIDASADAAASLTTNGESALDLTVPGSGFVIYAAETAIPASAAAPGIAISSPSSDAVVELGVQLIDGNEVPDQLEIVAELDSDQFAEVTFAVRATGTTSYTVIGVDNNPPYRVFHDVSGLASENENGAALDIIAVVNDLNGHYNSATVSNVQPRFTDEGGGEGGGYGYAIIHYQRDDGDYGDHTTGDFNDYWGLHLWGDGIADGEGTEWTAPQPFLGETDYGRFAWVKLQDSSQDVNFIVHRGDTKDGTEDDRSFNPDADGPEIWLKQDDGTFYTARAAAQGFVTIHYQRDDGDYGDPTSDDFNNFWGLHLWGDAIADGVATEWTAPRPFDGIDDFGAYWQIPIVDATQPVNFIIHRGDAKSPNEADQSLDPSTTPAVWAVHGDAIYDSRGAAEGFVTIHYHRPEGDYGDYDSGNHEDFWGLHTWQAAEDPGWTTPRKPAEIDTFGPVFQVPLIDTSVELAYILHRGDEKDPGPDQFLDYMTIGYEVWQLQGADPENPYIKPIPRGAGGGAGGDITIQKAHWVSEKTIAWDVEVDPSHLYTLHYARDGGMMLAGGQVNGGETMLLTPDPDGPSDAVKAKFPHLAGYAAFTIADTDLGRVPDALKGQLAISAASGGTVVDATGLQIPGVLDDLYTYDGPLGPDLDAIGTAFIPFTTRLWAPTAHAVRLHLFLNADDADPLEIIDMTQGESGVWSATVPEIFIGKYYLFEVEVYAPSTGQVETNLVTDPYSLGLSTDSKRSLFVNLNLPETQPEGWADMEKPALAAPEDITLYELHVRDFSISDETVPDADRGNFTAFTAGDSDGMTHLRALADAGLTHVHLLPVFDIATVPEDPADRVDPEIPADAGPASTVQREAIEPVRDQDGFNWGYDPYHYTVPEGSYATDADGATRNVEFRQMVQALHAAGLRVVMDVVYNHTHAAGQAERSVLDRIVPGYYHRLDENGNVTTSTCCPNTATEHNMMEKLMIDSLVTWARHYGVDGFRFDLMGHHMVRNMEAVQAALAEVDPTIYMYGEGWNFGEVENGARGENAIQLNLPGTGIGTFNDRMRDAVRGGGPFDTDDAVVANQGFISGLYYAPNAANDGSQDERDRLLLYGDQIRVGLAGNLASYEFENAAGETVTGAQIDYNGSPTGYTQDPQEHIIYVSAHDNETLWDITQYKLPADTTMADRVAIQKLGIDLSVLAQGVPFFHAGVEMLRSKSLDRNSYNSGDWFNELDFSYESNNWGSGLPFELAGPQAVATTLLSNGDLAPSESEIREVVDHMRTMLAVRNSSPLFRLHTAADVQARLRFHNTGPDQIPGVIAMSLSDQVAGLPDLDPRNELIVVFFNATDEPQTLVIPELDGTDLTPSGALTALRESNGASVVNGEFTIPARSSNIFMNVEPVDATSLFLPAVRN